METQDNFDIRAYMIRIQVKWGQCWHSDLLRESVHATRSIIVSEPFQKSLRWNTI